MPRSAVAPRASPRRRRVVRPSTTEGRLALLIVAAGLAVFLFAALIVRPVYLPVVGPISLFGLLCVLVGGFYGLVAVVRRGERSIPVLAALAVWLFWVVFLIGELADPH